MISFLGLRVNGIQDKQKYKEALQEIKHYLSFQSSIVMNENEYIVEVRNDSTCFSLPKNVLYLHTNYYKMPILHQQDFHFIQICFECLMIIREAFPTKVAIQLVSEADNKNLMNLQKQKEEDFSRRVNNNLKALLEEKSVLSRDDVEDLIFLAQSQYTKKNKLLAIKLLLNHINHTNSAIDTKYKEILTNMQRDSELKKPIADLLNKLKEEQESSYISNENVMKMSNVSLSDIKIKPLIFQLKQSNKLQRIVALLNESLSSNAFDKDKLSKLQSSIDLIANRFVNGEYEDSSKLAKQLQKLIECYWQKRNRRWDSQISTIFAERVNGLQLSRFNSNSRALQNAMNGNKQ